MKNKITGFLAALLAACVLVACSVDSPVSGDYFNDLDKVKGGEKPGAPTIVAGGVTQPQPDEIKIAFQTESITDPETGSNDNLYYLIYYWDENPATGFDDPREYYSAYYYLGYVKDSDYSGTDPKEVSFSLNPNFHGTLWFWMTSYDGGRESDHSNVESIIIP